MPPIKEIIKAYEINFNDLISYEKDEKTFFKLYYLLETIKMFRRNRLSSIRHHESLYMFDGCFDFDKELMFKLFDESELIIGMFKFEFDKTEFKLTINHLSSNDVKFIFTTEDITFCYFDFKVSVNRKLKHLIHTKYSNDIDKNLSNVILNQKILLDFMDLYCH